MKKLKLAQIVSSSSQIKGRYLVRAKIDFGEKKGPKERLYLLHPIAPDAENTKRKHFLIKKKDKYFLRLQTLNLKDDVAKDVDVEKILDISPFELT